MNTKEKYQPGTRIRVLKTDWYKPELNELFPYYVDERVKELQGRSGTVIRVDDDGQLWCDFGDRVAAVIEGTDEFEVEDGKIS